MVKPRTILLLLAPLAASCVADAQGDAVGEVAEPEREPGPWSPDLDNLTGPCADACKVAAAGTCDWDDLCVRPIDGPAQPADRRVAICAGLILTCKAFDYADKSGHTVTDIGLCYRACEGLHD